MDSVVFIVNTEIVIVIINVYTHIRNTVPICCVIFLTTVSINCYCTLHGRMEDKNSTVFTILFKRSHTSKDSTG